MRIVSKEPYGIRPVFSTNVEDNGNYITKSGVINKNCVVDEEYRGELHINVINVGNKTQSIPFGSKLTQFLLIEVDQMTPTEISIDEYYKYENTDRGVGGFGSTGTK